MTHPNADQLWLHLHDALEADERAALDVHLEAGCEVCAELQRKLRDGAGTMALGAPSRVPPDAVRERVALTFADAVAADDLRRHRQIKRPSVYLFPRIAFAAGIAAGLLLGIVGARALGPPPASDLESIASAESTLERTRVALLEQIARLDASAASWEVERARWLGEVAQEREAAFAASATTEQLARANADLTATLRATEDRLAQRELVAARLTQERDQLTRALADADDAMALLESPGVEWVVLSPEDTTGPGAARFFWAWDRGDCMIDAGNLPRVAEGQAMALWITYESGEPTLVGTFAPERDGTVRVLAPMPAGQGDVRAVRITVENALRPTAPGGQTVLAGELF